MTGKASEGTGDWTDLPPGSSSDHVTGLHHQRHLVDPAGAATLADEVVDFAPIYRFERIILAVVPAVFGLIALLGLVGNLVVVVVIISNRQMHNTTNVLIVSLAFADLLFIVVCVPFTAIGYSVPTWPFGDAWCKIYQYVAQVTAYASVYTLVLMSLDRYLAVVHPIRSISIRTYLNASLVSGITWLLILVCNSPIILEFETIEYTFVDGQRRSACMNVYIYNNDSLVDGGAYYHGRLYYGCFFAFAYVVPLSLVCLLYGLMIRRLLCGVIPGGTATATDEEAPAAGAAAAAAAGGTRAFSAAKTAERSRGKRRVTRLVLVVVVVFAVCWLPLQLIFVIQFVIMYPDQDMEHTGLVVTKIVFSCLAYMNSCLNPILYAFLSDNFRKSVRRTTGEWCRPPLRRRLCCAPAAAAAAGAPCLRWCPSRRSGSSAGLYTEGRAVTAQEITAGRSERTLNGDRAGDARSTRLAVTEFDLCLMGNNAVAAVQ